MTPPKEVANLVQQLYKMRIRAIHRSANNCDKPTQHRPFRTPPSCSSKIYDTQTRLFPQTCHHRQRTGVVSLARSPLCAITLIESNHSGPLPASVLPSLPSGRSRRRVSSQASCSFYFHFHFVLTLVSCVLACNNVEMPVRGEYM